MYPEDSIRDANQSPTCFVIKRNGQQVPFQANKIRCAIQSSNNEELRIDERLTQDEIENIVDIITNDVYHTNHPLSVEEIQDRVEREICKRSYNVFLLFHDFRSKHSHERNKSVLDKKIESIIDVEVTENGTVTGKNEEVRQENSNKNPTILSVQRDYIAGEWSRHYMRNSVLPNDVQEAHDKGVIHFHDTDYTSMHMHNCDLVNLNDMLQNGTKISGTVIERPKSFLTACTVMSQIAASVASSQYGGQSCSIGHLSPFVDVSRQKIKKRYEFLNDLLPDDYEIEIDEETLKKDCPQYKRKLDKKNADNYNSDIS